MAFLRFASSAVLLLPLACGDDAPANTSSNDSTGATGPMTSTTSDVDPDTSDDGPAPTTHGDAASTEETGFDPPMPACGNGFVEDDEECDDGNKEDGDSCNSACQIPCGLQWGMLVLGPTLDSEIEGRAITRDGDDQIVLSGLLQEVTVEMDGTVVEGDNTVLVQSHMPEGGLVWEQVLSEPTGNLDATGIAVDDAGNIYTAATVQAEDGGTAIRAWRLAAADGTVEWTHDFDGPFEGEDETVFGIALGPDGNLVLSGQVRAGDGDDDIWLRKLDGAAGTELWTQTYSGSPLGMFSTDDGGPVAIGPDGSIYVLARIYEDFSTIRGHVLRFDADGGEPTWTYVPEIDGANQDFALQTITVSTQGPVFAVSRVDGSDTNFWMYQLDPDGALLWSRERADFEVEGAGSDWIVEDMATAGEELVVLGRYLAADRFEGVSWWEPWVARLDTASETRCQVLHQADFDGLFPPSLLGYGVGVASDGSALVTGEQNSADESGLWIGSFRN